MFCFLSSFMSIPKVSIFTKFTFRYRDKVNTTNKFRVRYQIRKDGSIDNFKPAIRSVTERVPVLPTLFYHRILSER